MTTRPVIALLTDFGAADWFVGSIKAVILARAPDCAIVDLCHAIEPGHVAQGAWLLDKTSRDFPPGTIFCAVVDPGVGTERQALAARIDRFFFVAPDNGLLSRVLERGQSLECRAIPSPSPTQPAPSRTFHGRDVFAPAAARIALNGAIGAAWPLVPRPVRLEAESFERVTTGAIVGSIIFIDRFGNAITTIERQSARRLGIETTGRVAIVSDGGGTEGLMIERLSATFSDVAPGEPVAYWGSLETLEIAVRDGSARDRYGLRLGQTVELKLSLKHE
jgi:hypothetical protein